MKTMKLKNKIFLKICIISIVLLPVISCSDLKEEILDETTGKELINDDTNIPNLVVPAYASLRDLWWRQSVWGMQEASTDECMFPTRGSDWSDGGVWVEFHTHTWTPEHRDITDTWNRLATGIARANYVLDILNQKPATAEITQNIAELRFLRAYYMYYYLDLYGQVPFRESDETDYSKNPMVYNRIDGFEKIVGEIEDVIPDLGTKSSVPYGRINKDIATMLLAKLYLNKEVYTGVPDWEKCKQYCNELINSGRYAINENYFDIFSVDNYQFYTNSDEAIFVTIFDDSEDMGSDNNCNWVHPTLHYNQTLGGYYSPWNGCVVLAEFFNKIDTTNDLRFQDDRIKAATGANLGFLIGQQYNENGVALSTRQNTPLNYSVDCPLTGATEEKGIRVMKYEPRVPTVNSSRTTSDFVIWRISDVYLMRAEADFNINGGGLPDLNELRTKRGLNALTTISADAILNERGFELYWEGHRRQDLIRFGKFTDAMQDKPVSPETVQIYPIPQVALDAYSDLTLISQNPGY